MKPFQVGFAAISFALVLAAQARAQEPTSHEVEPDQALATYETSLGAARISGASRSLVWSIRPTAAGESEVRLRLVVDSFETGHAAIDAAVRKAMDSRRFPTVEVAGTVRPGDSLLRGTITVRGVARPLTAKLLQSRIGDRLLLRTWLTVSLAAFGISAPDSAEGELGDSFEVTVLGRLHARPGAILSGGGIRSRE